MVVNLEKQIYELIRPYAGTYLFTGKEVPLTPETDLDTDLQIDEAEIEDLMDAFFTILTLIAPGLRSKLIFLIHLSHGISLKKRNPFRCRISLLGC